MLGIIKKNVFLNILLIVLGTWTFAPLHAAVNDEKLQELFAQGITVDLREPVFSDGVLTTDKGGVVTGPNLRVQAMKIRYTRKVVDKEPVMTIEAEDQLLFEYENYIFIADRLEYDFQTKEGTLYVARSALEPWYFGGERIDLHADGSIDIHAGFITTSPNTVSDWRLFAAHTNINSCKVLKARNIRFEVLSVPILWIPTFQSRLDQITDPPIRYRIRWGGEQGWRVGVIYDAFEWRGIKTTARFDYRLERGPGGGIETNYESPTGNQTFSTINYIARDNSIEEPQERTRYRFEGIYSQTMQAGTQSIDFSYDKLSDKEMPTDYYEKGLDLKTAGKTQLAVRKQYDDTAITSLFTRVRINDFQSVKQELPTLTGSLHPLALGNTGIISENLIKVGYLDYQYANDLPNTSTVPSNSLNLYGFNTLSDYHSSRFEVRERLYRTMYSDFFTLTPDARGIFILYGSSPHQNAQGLGVLSVGGEIKSQLIKSYPIVRHTIEPYARYQYLTTNTPPTSHFIFDIQDGWTRIDTLRFGVRNLFYTRMPDCLVGRVLTSDIYTYAFFNTPTIPVTFPKVFAQVTWDMLPTVRHNITAAWDLEHHIVDHANFRTDITINQDLAFAFEFRQRSKYAWRKIDFDNWNIESFYTEATLLNSPLSDRRNTLLGKVFYRFLPNLACEFQMRHGWHRLTEPEYWEYQVDLITHIRSAWDVRLSYQNREDDHRVAFFISLVPQKPIYNCCKCW